MMKSHFTLVTDDAVEEEEEEVTETDIEPQVPEQGTVLVGRLDKHEITCRLSWLGRTACGDGYTYLKVECKGMQLKNINSIQLFKYLQYVNVSNNFLTTEALQVVSKLPFLVALKANRNLLVSAKLNRCKYLQVIVVNHNEILTVEDMYHPNLSTIECAYNKVKDIIFFHRMSSLRVLDCRYNFIKDLSNIDCPGLDSLYLAGNKIKDLTGIQQLQNIRVLHLRDNPIRQLDALETVLPKLEYLNLRSCKIQSLKQVKKLSNQPKLQTLVLIGTPFMGAKKKDDDVYAVYDEEKIIPVFATLPRLRRLDKNVFSEEERAEAKALQQQWQHEGEDEGEEEEEIEEEKEDEEEKAEEEQQAAGHEEQSEE